LTFHLLLAGKVDLQAGFGIYSDLDSATSAPAGMLERKAIAQEW